MKDPLTDETILYSVKESVAFWVEHNNCDPVPEITTSDDGRIIITTYTNGSQGTEVVLHTVLRWAHRWHDEYNELIWDFFESHPKH